MLLKNMKLSLRFAAVALSLSLMNCAGHTPATNTTDACSWAKPILVSRQDVLTDETAREILTYDQSVRMFCGGR